MTPPVFVQVRERVLSRETRFVIIMDTTALVGTPTARQRQLIANWTREHEPILARLAGGAVSVSTSPLVRGLVTAIEWLAPSAVPRRTETTVQAAEAWAIERLYGPATLAARERIARRESRWPSA